MFYQYFWFFCVIGLCALFSAFASFKVRRAYNEYSCVANLSGMTGYDAALRLLHNNGVYDISIGKVRGTLSDHYHPTKKIVNLSQDTFDYSSVAAVAVAAHEIGHVMQNKTNYWFYKLRTALVPIVNFCSGLAMPLVIIGILLEFFVTTTQPDIGFYFAIAGTIMYGSSLLFALVTLPVELDASKRAKKMLLAEGILNEQEIDGAKKVLSAAALTYLASLLTSLVYFLRFLFYVLTIFGRRSRD